MSEILLVLYSFHIGGNCEAFENTYQDYLPQQKQFPGHLGETLVRQQGEQASYMIVSRWQASSFYRWLQSPEHDSMVSMLNSFRRDSSSVKKYVVAHGDEVPVS